MLKKFLKNDKGLTLVELLAVIVILGIIAAIAVPSIGSIIEKSRADAVKAEGLQVLNAAKLFVASEGVPTTDNATTANQLTIDDLENYLTENVTDSIWSDATIVKVPDTNTLQLNGAGTKGSVVINFNDATISQINEYEYDSDDETHTVPVPTE
ncbi:type IV pilin protein [Bacillus sp. Marseille-Q1617]|uniref:type IV pilin protein n=1 Tax=Bacillus sp. Marseille-Q1617 TaxID=2736887 RepID=UPI00158EA5B6|nr:prepilin-type N-terminal cleavage/methylation domain-containing protein [Bacillus sp. Marseille-Q1617]